MTSLMLKHVSCDASPITRDFLSATVIDWNFHSPASFFTKFGLRTGNPSSSTRINHSNCVDSQRNAHESKFLKTGCDMLVQNCRHLRTAKEFLNTEIKIVYLATVILGGERSYNGYRITTGSYKSYYIMAQFLTNPHTVLTNIVGEHRSTGKMGFPGLGAEYY
ncbi:hypothetical protein T11_11786 [Trichinella zimbabwensis]|uniref:Uncharacterized protein n=1 Tax=Trichinella zimbabwensis TaxID=268475 RepID=A0A0V1GUV7_9BILA|nr:hypothetical protein T11_11786 [Trichinella zimbabwensis]